MKIFQKNSRGFTLIELLVVVAIISLLSSVVMASLNTARSKARDAKRLTEIHQFQNALELYYNDNGYYPDVCVAGSNGLYIAGWSTLTTLLTPSYISSMPIDPINTVGQYGYYYCSQFKPNGNCGYTSTPGIKTNYALVTRLENTSASSNSCPTSFGAADNPFSNYIVGSGS